jgi:glycosyltransferase involved in cell wall biosynthesis
MHCATKPRTGVSKKLRDGGPSAAGISRRSSPAPAVSVVIPVYNAAPTLKECLTRLGQSSIANFEVIVVDDGSTDQSNDILAKFPVRVLLSSERIGPAAARNLGAQAATAEFLFFIDSDVMVRPETLALLLDAFNRTGVDGLCGVQAVEMRHRDLVSQYKNQWMRWTYLRQAGDIPLFYTTSAAIRRDVFLRVGGFDVGYTRPNVEDTAFGQKLKRLGIRVQVHPELEVEHVKHYSLWRLLQVDFMRAISLTRLKLRHPKELWDNNSSVPTSFIASVPLSGLAVLGLLLGHGAGSPLLTFLGVLASASLVGLNAGFLDALARSQGRARALAAVPILWLELLVVGAGVTAGLLTFLLGRRY